MANTALQIAALVCFAVGAIAPSGGELPRRVNFVALGLFLSLLGILIG